MYNVNYLNLSCFFMLVLLKTPMFYIPITKTAQFFHKKTTSFEVVRLVCDWFCLGYTSIP